MGAKGMGHICISKKEIANKGKDCWKGCEKTQGRCEWCGTDGWCCRLGWEGNGCDGSMGASGMGHVCTSKEELPTTAIANKGKDCWWGCKKTQGECEWCGTEGWCCRLGWKGNGCDGKMGAEGMGHVCISKDTSVTTEPTTPGGTTTTTVTTEPTTPGCTTTEPTTTEQQEGLCHTEATVIPVTTTE